MGNIIIILIYLSEYLAATFTEAFTQDRSLSSLKSQLPLHCWTPITLPVESVPRHQTSELQFLLLDTFKILRLVCFLL